MYRREHSLPPVDFYDIHEDFMNTRVKGTILWSSEKIEVDPSGLKSDAPGAKLDAGKTRVWLMLSGFANALDEVAKVTTVGAVKYSPGGWAHVEGGEQRYMEAFGRHLIELGGGALVDDGPNGTGCLHKAQMIWNLLASLELELRNAKD